MAKIPTPETITGPASFRPDSPAPVADYSAIGKGLSNLGTAASQVVRQEQEKQNVIDFAAADAFATKSYLDMQNQFEEDGDYATFSERAERGSQDITSNAASMIRSSKARQQWIAANEPRRLTQVDAIGDRARGLANQAEAVRLEESLAQYGRLLTEPSTPDSVLTSTRQSMQATIDFAVSEGLWTPEQGATAKQQFITLAEQQRALNLVDSNGRVDPEGVIAGLGIGPTGDPLNDARTSITLPVITGDGIDLADIDPATLSRYEQVQSAFGTQLPVISGQRTPEHNAEVGGAENSRHQTDNGGDAIDVDVSQLSKEERVRLIETASAMGFTGIGVYNNSLHLDTRGERQSWGPSYSSGSVPAWAKDVIDRHTSGQIAEVPVSAGANVAPEYAALSYEQRAAAFDRTKQVIQQRGMEMRVGIETTVQNAPVAIARQGEYTGTMPTANDFVQAYGAQDGIEKYKAFDASVKVAQDSFAMRTMTPEQISGILEQATPTSTGDDALAQEQRMALLSQAADSTMKMRAEDPVGYVTSAFPAVADAWERTANDDANGTQMKIAIASTALAQESLGMETLTLLPPAMATEIAARFNNPQLSDAERTGLLTSMVTMPPNPEHQLAVYNQLIAAGVSPNIRPAMAAMERGPDGKGAADRLFRAAMAPTAELDKALPESIKPTELENSVQMAIFEPGSIGDVYYDITYGGVANTEEATTEMAVFSNSVKMRLIDGTAGGNVQTAIDMTTKDMFGDVEVVNGSGYGGRAGMKILLPKGADPKPYQDGFDALMGEVGEAHAASLKGDGDAYFGAPETGTAQGAIRDAALAATVEQTLAAGYFTSAGDGLFKFIDPNAQAPVLGADGQPLTFTEQEVLAAGAEASQMSIINQPGLNPAQQAGATFDAGVIQP